MRLLKERCQECVLGQYFSLALNTICYVKFLFGFLSVHKRSAFDCVYTVIKGDNVLFVIYSLFYHLINFRF